MEGKMRNPSRAWQGENCKSENCWKMKIRERTPLMLHNMTWEKERSNVTTRTWRDNHESHDLHFTPEKARRDFWQLIAFITRSLTSSLFLYVAYHILPFRLAISSRKSMMRQRRCESIDEGNFKSSLEVRGSHPLIPQRCQLLMTWSLSKPLLTTVLTRVDSFPLLADPATKHREGLTHAVSCVVEEDTTRKGRLPRITAIVNSTGAAMSSVRRVPR